MFILILIWNCISLNKPLFFNILFFQIEIVFAPC